MKKPGRNDPCPCGSGKKFKKCCLDREQKAPKEVSTEAAKVNPKLFPLKTKEETYIAAPLFENGNGRAFFPMYYESGYAQEYSLGLWNDYKTETLIGKYVASKTTIESDGHIILPVAPTANNTSVSLVVNGYPYDLKYFGVKNLKRYQYLRIQEKGSVTVSANKPVVVGKPINIEQSKAHDTKLNLCLFIDGLAQHVFDMYSMEQIMPNTFYFFKKGAIFDNCYANAEWTLASVPSIFSGKYAANHGVFHPELPQEIGNGYKIISNFFQDDDYVTFQACGNWRKTPSYGYVKGFDRTIYQSGTMGGLCKDIIFTFLENMRTFDKRDHFAWLTFMELHNLNEMLHPDISVSSNLDIDKMQRVVMQDVKSVDMTYDEAKIDRCVSELQRLDFYLKILYNFIEENYNDDEFLIALCSDHGQMYFDDNSDKLKDTKARVPFMLRGKDVPCLLSDELIENVDILPTILRYAGLDLGDSQIDGSVPMALGGEKEKDYVYSESIYPGQTYKARIRDKNHVFYFESEGLVDQNGRFKLGSYYTRLVEKAASGADLTCAQNELAEKYTKVALEHVKSRQHLAD